MAVQQNKKSPSKRGMHRFAQRPVGARHRRRADHRRNPSAPPCHQPEWLLPWSPGHQVQDRSLIRLGRARRSSGPCAHLSANDCLARRYSS